MDPVIVEIRPPMLMAQAEAAAKEAAQEGRNPKEVVDEYIETHTIRLGFVSATRRQSYKRGDAMQAAMKWLLDLHGVKSIDDIDLSAMDKDTTVTWIAAWQSADIIGALVSHENWEPPKRPEDWADIPDYIFNPALAMTWQLNPQWAAERAEAAEGNS